MRISLSFALAFCLAVCYCATSLSQDPPDDFQWQVFRIGGQSYYRVPYDVMRELGYDVPDIPDDRNAAIKFLEAARNFNVIPIDWPGWDALEELMNRPWTEDEFPEMAEWLEINEDVFDLLDQALALDECYFPLFADKPGDTELAGMMLPHLTIARNMARALAMRANLRAGEGRMTRSIDDIIRIMELGELIGREQGLMSGLLANFVVNSGVSAIKGLLQSGILDAESLEDLQRRMTAARDGLPDPVNAIEGEKISSLNQLDQIMFGEVPAGEVIEGDREDRDADALSAFLRGRAYRALIPDRTIRADFVDFYDRLAEHSQRPFWETQGIDYLFADLKPYNFMILMLSPIMSRVLEEYAVCEANYECAIQAVAIMRYMADHGDPPAALDELVPDYLDELPLDPFSGEPFVFALENGGFVIYSWGRNRRDDGGREVGLADWDGDIVIRIGED